MSEEELSHKEVKAELRLSHSYEFIPVADYVSAPVASKPVSKHDTVSAKIFIPPPEQI